MDVGATFLVCLIIVVTVIILIILWVIVKFLNLIFKAVYRGILGDTEAKK